MLPTSLFLASLLATSLAIPFKRDDTGKELLAALGNGAVTGLTGVLETTAEKAATAAAEKAASALSKVLTSALSKIGKRDDTGKELLAALGNGAVTGLTGVLETTAEKAATAAAEKAASALSKVLTSALSKIGKRDDTGKELLAALGNGAVTGLTGVLETTAEKAATAAAEKAASALSKVLTSALSKIGKRDDTGKELLAALGNGAVTGLTGVLETTAEKAATAAAEKAASALSKVLTSALSKIGKRDDTGKELLAALGNGAVTGLTGVLETTAEKAATAAAEKAASALSKVLTSALSKIGKRDDTGKELLAALGNGAVTGLTGVLETTAEKAATAAAEKAASALSKVLTSALSKIGKRDDTGKELLAALGNGAVTGLTGVLETTAEKAATAAAEKAAAQLTKLVTSLVGKIGKRDSFVETIEKEALKLLEGKIEKIVAQAITRRSLKDDIMNILGNPEVQKTIENAVTDFILG